MTTTSHRIESERQTAIVRNDWMSPLLTDEQKLALVCHDGLPNAAQHNEFERLHDQSGSPLRHGRYQFWPDGAWRKIDWPHEIWFDASNQSQIARAQHYYWTAVYNAAKEEFDKLRQRLEREAKDSLGKRRGLINGPSLTPEAAKKELTSLRNRARDAAERKSEAAQRMEKTKPISPIQAATDVERQRKQDQHREVMSAIQGIEL